MTALALVAAQLLDWFTAMTHGPYWYEQGTVVPWFNRAVVGEPLLALAVKLTLLSWVFLALWATQKKGRRHLFTTVTALGVGSGLVGAWSNL